jgi:hypothetical protein
MRYQGNIVENLQSAAKAKDKALIKELVVDKTASLIENDPKAIITALKKSGVKVSDNATKLELIDLASVNLYENRLFQKNLAVTLVNEGMAQDSDYANSTGQGFDLGGLLGGLGGGGGDAASAGSGGGGGGGAAAAGIVSSVADMVGSISQWGASKNQLVAQEQQSKQMMYSRIFGEKKKTNWLPIVIVAGVLLIGGVVVWRVTAKK